MVFYICQRNGQCSSPCSEDCCYTSEFSKSKIAHNSVKPKSILVIKDLHGNWWEVDYSWDRNIPKKFRADPEEIIEIPYDYILQLEIGRRLKVGKKF